MTGTDAAAHVQPCAVGVISASSGAVAGHLLLFAVGGGFIWVSAFGLVVVVALVCWAAIALVVLAGTLLLARRPTRRLGTGLILGSLLAGLLQAVFAFALLTAYSSANPGWDLS
ncbi:hypothetical protein JCM18899A_05190 [Nocardioides sp. AN3]